MATRKTSILTAGPNNHLTTSEEANQFATDFVTPGILGLIGNTSGVAPMSGGFAVNAQGTPNMTVAVSGGIVYVTTVPSTQNSQVLRTAQDVAENVPINPNSSGATVYDYVYLRHNVTNANAPDVNATTVADLYVSRSSSNNVDNGTPPSYNQLLAIITVANGASSITNAMIRDARAAGGINYLSQSSGLGGWILLNNGISPSSVVYNGNRSYTLQYNGVDLTTILSAGMRFRTTRTVASQTVVTSLNSASSQFWSKTGPAGMTVTDDFVGGIWVKPSSYATGVLASRFDGSNGWQLYMESTGQITFRGYNGGGANYRGWTSYQSIPLNKWTHIAGQLDMSAITSPGVGASATTNYLMIDGLDALILTGVGGTSPVALALGTGPLQIGASNGGAFFPGKIAQAFITSAKLTQNQVTAIYSQGLTSADMATYSIISAYSFDSNANDLNATNGNNLTSNGGATALANDSFSGNSGKSSTLDFSIIVADPQYAGGNTSITLHVAEGCTIPTSGGVSSAYYSNAGSPYGFPRQKAKWTIDSLQIADTTTTYSAAGTYYNHAGWRITVPVGEWEFSQQLTVANQGTVAAGMAIRTAVGTAPTALLPDLVSRNELPSATNIEISDRKTTSLSLSAPITYAAYVQFEAGGGTGTSRYFGSAIAGQNLMTALNAFL